MECVYLLVELNNQTSLAQQKHEQLQVKYLIARVFHEPLEVSIKSILLW